MFGEIIGHFANQGHGICAARRSVDGNAQRRFAYVLMTPVSRNISDAEPSRARAVDPN